MRNYWLAVKFILERCQHFSSWQNVQWKVSIFVEVFFRSCMERKEIQSEHSGAVINPTSDLLRRYAWLGSEGQIVSPDKIMALPDELILQSFSWQFASSRVIPLARYRRLDNYDPDLNRRSRDNISACIVKYSWSGSKNIWNPRLLA